MMTDQRPLNAANDESQPSAQRARGLARLLLYAMLDATDLGSRKTVVEVQNAIDQLKSEYGLTDSEIMRI